MFGKKKRGINPILHSVLWNAGVFSILIILAFISAWLLSLIP
jgi:hypothetical protein